MSDIRPDEHLLVEAADLILVSSGEEGGAPQETVLQFAYDDGVVYLLAQAAADWYGNIRRDSGVVVRVRRRGFRGRARLFDAKQRAKMVDRIAAMFKRKYGAGALKGSDLDALLPVAIDIH